MKTSAHHRLLQIADLALGLATLDSYRLLEPASASSRHCAPALPCAAPAERSRRRPAVAASAARR